MATYSSNTTLKVSTYVNNSTSFTVPANSFAVMNVAANGACTLTINGGTASIVAGLSAQFYLGPGQTASVTTNGWLTGTVFVNNP